MSFVLVLFKPVIELFLLSVDMPEPDLRKWSPHASIAVRFVVRFFLVPVDTPV